ncbi:hypothetical protein ACLQ2R_13075 [Streptosporangium sp. DT93]|uniref:hypothetical protein n=1 Tax=Streptosporangium sp. DT93 TaxID=3393428 RepID=UPI003CE97FD5
MLDGLGGTQGTRETGSTPTDATADAETSERPEATAQSPRRAPAPQVPAIKRSRIGDLQMRVIYRALAVGAAVLLVAVVAVVGLVTSGTPDQPGEERAGQIAAPSAAPPSPGPASTGPASPEPSAPASASASESPSASGSASPSGSVSPSASPSASGSPSASSSASSGSTPAPDRSAVVAALADPRVPEPPGDRRLGRLTGKADKSKRRLTDRRSGVSLVRLGKPWKVFGASPFSTRQVLPKVKGAAHRAMLVSCPVPILVQREAKDTALLAARWTLNHHPKGGTISWTASQPIKDGWLLAYRVKYESKGKARSSMAAVAVTERSGEKPAMLFVTIPDVQKKHWRDINTAVSSLRLK